MYGVIPSIIVSFSLACCRVVNFKRISTNFCQFVLFLLQKRLCFMYFLEILKWLAGKEKKFACALLTTSATVCVKKGRKSRVWQINWLTDCDKYGYISLLKELRENHPDDFKNYLSMYQE